PPSSPAPAWSRSATPATTLKPRRCLHTVRDALRERGFVVAHMFTTHGITNPGHWVDPDTEPHGDTIASPGVAWSGSRMVGSSARIRQPDPALLGHTQAAPGIRMD